ncbi:MAG: DUF523 domain-containing protein [Gammaproteobacteria bacterium]|nr:DUF523 domain-containing protein [Gammaproteobacteria bacterium]
MKEKIAVSACLMGANVKYNGENNLSKKVLEYTKDKTVVLICPEVFSGMPIPRIPCEVVGDKVINEKGIDMTDHFIEGAKKALKLLKDNNVSKVILKDGSPSCGYTYIYDGTFSHKRISALGYTTRLLKENGIEVIDLNER